MAVNAIWSSTNEPVPAGQQDVHALDARALLDPAVTFFSYRSGGKLLAVGAFRRIDADHVELESTHTRY